MASAVDKIIAMIPRELQMLQKFCGRPPKSIVTSAAVVAGGSWALWRFVLTREGMPARWLYLRSILSQKVQMSSFPSRQLEVWRSSLAEAIAPISGVF
jgi:hypothetical protein